MNWRVILIICIVIIIIIVQKRMHLQFACAGGLQWLREPLRFLNDPHVNRLCQIDSKHKSIPRDLYITSHISKGDIPDLLGDFSADFNVHFYDDERATAFMQEYFPQYLYTYNNIKLGAHRADLWRYCILYKFGGVYLDVKVVPRVPLLDLMVHKDKYTWYVVMGGFGTEIFNAILATPPENPMILQCIMHIVRHPNPTWYHQYIHYLLMILEDNYKRPLTPGIFDRPDSRLVVWNEICRVADAKGGDVYGMMCRVFDDKQWIFDSRDPKYPWKSV